MFLEIKQEKKTRMKSKNESEFERMPSIALNMFVNLFVTFGLSLSIYLLIANIFLTYYKFSIQDGYLKGTSYTSDNHLDEKYSFEAEHRFSNYYDCSKNILTIEECNTLNDYHREYLNTVLKYLSTKKNGKYMLEQKNSLKVNTSLFVH